MTDSHKGAPDSPAAILAFDTSTAALTAAVMRDGAVLASVQSFAERNHSVRLVPELKRLLRETGLAPAEIGAIAVGRGPGSYTGVRIAVSAAKTLAWSWNKPLVGVSSLEALALGAWESERERGTIPSGTWWVVPVMDARRGQVYTARFAAHEDGGWSRLDDDRIVSAADWAETLRGEASRPAGPAGIWIAGESEPHRETFLSRGSESLPIRTIPFAMEAAAVGRLAAARLENGDTDDIHSFVPNYTQLAEAEAKLLAAAARRE